MAKALVLGWQRVRARPPTVDSGPPRPFRDPIRMSAGDGEWMILYYGGCFKWTLRIQPHPWISRMEIISPLPITYIGKQRRDSTAAGYRDKPNATR